MVKLIWDAAFKRSYKKRIASDIALKKKFWDMLQLFSQNPFDSRLKTHKLAGKLQGLWAFSITHDCRVVFQFMDNTTHTVLLIDIGSHDEVY